MNWTAKALVQAALSAVPGGGAANYLLQRINAARRGTSALSRRIAEVSSAVEALDRIYPVEGSVVVEVGTGWDALPTLCLSGAGAARVHTYDHVRHLKLALARRMAGHARSRWPSLAPMLGARSLSSFLRIGRITYTAPGDARRTGLPDQSVDIFFSYAVLEHVRPEEARELIAEARRVLKPGGVFYALIGLHDHFHNFDPSCRKVNFLRFSESHWRLIGKNRLAYHNRLRERDFLTMLGDAEIVHRRSQTDPEDVAWIADVDLPARWRSYSPEELAVSRSELVVRFAPSAALAEDACFCAFQPRRRHWCTSPTRGAAAAKRGLNVRVLAAGGGEGQLLALDQEIAGRPTTP